MTMCLDQVTSVDQNDGTYLLAYTLTRAGAYAVSVMSGQSLPPPHAYIYIQFRDQGAWLQVTFPPILMGS